MITFTRKAGVEPSPKDVDENRFEQVRKAAKERHRKHETDGTRRGDRPTAEDRKPT